MPPHHDPSPQIRADAAVSIVGLAKRYATGVEALKPVDLEIRRGEIFALLGPNGAGKTTLISIVCGIVVPSAGRVTVDGHDIVRDYRITRSRVGLVPQELTTDAFETVWNTVSFSRGIFGRPPDPALIERVLRDLTLWEKRGDKIMTLSGGMKRRVMIAKALSHEPEILFLDEPTAGVDVNLRRDMWAMVRALRERGVTIILTTHYIEEAESMADRIGVIRRGELILVEEKAALMTKLGRKHVTVLLEQPIEAAPGSLAPWQPVLADGGRQLECDVDTAPAADGSRPARGTGALLDELTRLGLVVRELNTRQSSLEDIFVGLVDEAGDAARAAA